MELGAGAGWRWVKGERNGGICDNVNNENEVKNNKNEVTNEGSSKKKLFSKIKHGTLY